MPFVANTPESLVKRSDSKDPATTCRGITSSGRPCRSPLKTDDSPKPKSRKKHHRVDDPSDPENYCWRHKDQANASSNSTPGLQSNGPILGGRTSIDSLTNRLNLLQTSPEKPSRPQYSSSKPSRGFHFCCFHIPLDILDEEPAPGPRPRPHPVQASGSAKPHKSSSNNHSSPGRPSYSSQAPSHVSQTSQYLNLIPSDAPPQTASQLMAELAKPLSPQDEAGYIYIFWLTPESEDDSPATQTARSILDTETTRSFLEPPSSGRPDGKERRPSDILTSFADQATSIGTRSPTTTRSRGLSSGDEKKTLLLKIGRANNVQRRMNEWKRQCGYHLSLVRFYPYVQSGSGLEPRKMPHSHKVEKLIHMELEGLGMRISNRGPCEACGRLHKEWFEVDATKEGVMRVDEAIKRWSDWDEGR
ncbi:hypothetical protein SLS53_005067 [Cytospora paraplurivora]|uniref:Bacteriophage T5 Orf172 DNA-binding domain-containing protein n=1 Tax=Cytospora paraplurivora TaxID=2898453 RepID=A0AAN9UDU1_9PEZI